MGYHGDKAKQLQNELDNLGPEFNEWGLTKITLRNKIYRENKRELGKQVVSCSIM